MKNKKIIIIVVVLAIIALAVYFWLKAKKKTSVVGSTSQTIDQSIAASVNNVKQTLSAVEPLKMAQNTSPATQKQPFSSSQTPAPAPAPAPTATAFNYVNFVRDGSAGKAILQMKPVTREFNVGESVTIPDGPYKGTHKIWYIWKGADFRNLYLETPFTVGHPAQILTGQFYKA